MHLHHAVGECVCVRGGGGGGGGGGGYKTIPHANKSLRLCMPYGARIAAGKCTLHQDKIFNVAVIGPIT